MVENKEANVDFITKKVAKKLGKSEDLIAEIQKVYWQQVKKSLGEVKSDSVRVPYLGVFYINPNSLLKRIRVIIKDLRKAQYILKKGDFFNYHRKNDLEEELRELWKIKNQFAFREINNALTIYHHGIGYIPRYPTKEKNDGEPT